MPKVDVIYGEELGRNFEMPVNPQEGDSLLPGNPSWFYWRDGKVVQAIIVVELQDDEIVLAGNILLKNQPIATNPNFFSVVLEGSPF